VPTETLGVMGKVVAALPPTWSMYTTRQRWGFLAVLFLVSTSQFLDRSVISVLLEPIKQEFKVSDTMLGFFGGTCFALVYAVAGCLSPAGRIAATAAQSLRSRLSFGAS